MYSQFFIRKFCLLFKAFFLQTLLLFYNPVYRGGLIEATVAQ
jgi:hypothetical protein